MKKTLFIRWADYTAEEFNRRMDDLIAKADGWASTEASCLQNDAGIKVQIVFVRP